VESRWIEPAPLALLLVLAALPAFVAGVFVFRGLGRLGISEVASFFVSMPLLISA
jgi:drug/metabolite transporter (DMT)-like permease